MAAGDGCGIGNEHSAVGAPVRGTGAYYCGRSWPSGLRIHSGESRPYPIEYYDSEQQCYRGILPELLRMVAEDTGISFAYVNAGSEDSRLEMARNSQVEMVTAFRRGEFSRMVLPV